MCLPFDQRFGFVFTPFPGFAQSWRCLVWSSLFLLLLFVLFCFSFSPGLVCASRFVSSGLVCHLVLSRRVWFSISFCLVWSGLSSGFVSPGLVFHLISSRLIWFVVWFCLAGSGFPSHFVSSDLVCHLALSRLIWFLIMFCFVLSGLSSGFVSSALSHVFSYLFWFLIWRTLFFKINYYCC